MSQTVERAKLNEVVSVEASVVTFLPDKRQLKFLTDRSLPFSRWVSFEAEDAEESGYKTFWTNEFLVSGIRTQYCYEIMLFAVHKGKTCWGGIDGMRRECVSHERLFRNSFEDYTFEFDFSNVPAEFFEECPYVEGEPGYDYF